MGWREFVKREYHKYHDPQSEDDLKYEEVQARMREIEDGIARMEERRANKGAM